MRERAQLSQYDGDPDTNVAIWIPMDTICLSASFLRGMLGPSVRVLGKRALAKYELIGDQEEALQTERIEYFRNSLKQEIADLLVSRRRSRARGGQDRPEAAPRLSGGLPHGAFTS
jgi:hypothetical protein